MIACAQCGTAMPTPTGRASRRRYCSDACRKIAWTRRQHNPTPDPDLGILTDSVVVATASRDAVPTHGGQHRCPHCRQPLAVISVLVPAAAAHVNTPEVTHA